MSRVVVALGGNALLRRDDAPEALQGNAGTTIAVG
jgi:carbamate kinase